jgi:hypothetical protein
MHVPPLPLPAVRRLIGPELAGQLETLRARPAGTGVVVLFSDPRGAELALLTVGPGLRFERLEDAAKAEIDGLRALCVLDETAAPASPDGEAEASHMDETLRTRESFLEECEQRLADAGQRLAEREALVEQREQALLAKERDFFRRGGEATSQQ